MKRKDRAVKINNVWWTVKFKSMSAGKWGETDYDNRIISVEKNADDEMLLDTLCHEVGHVRFPYLKEDEMEGFGIDLKNVLWAFNWRVAKKES